MGMVCDLNEYFMCIDEPVVFYIYIYIYILKQTKTI